MISVGVFSNIEKSLQTTLLFQWDLGLGMPGWEPLIDESVFTNVI
jgi:hypothetical protein